MKSNQVSEVRLRNFRCFRDIQTARLCPLTLLVGDNSTGKTSFLAAVRAIWDAVHQQTEPDFRAPPYDLGAFREIAFNEGEDEDHADSFEIGFSGSDHRREIDADIRFVSQYAAPSPAMMSLKTQNAWITYLRKERKEAVIEFGADDHSWRVQLDPEEFPFVPFQIPLLIPVFLRRIDGLDINVKNISGYNDTHDSDMKDTIPTLMREFLFSGHPEILAGAPIRSSPHRTYDPTRPLPDPEGSYLPTYLASVNFRDKDQWNELKSSLEEFGKASGLFHEIEVKQLVDMEGGPFQLEIGIGGNGKAGRRRNLIDVGYGVSQALPILTEVLRTDAPPMFLFQQPEVHLHPSAQAELGSLFCSAAAAGRQLIIETHSDYIIDRVLLDIRDKRTDLKPDDVSILYFERADHAVTIHSIRIDAEGNVLDPPEGYRKFFKDELNRVIDY